MLEIDIAGIERKAKRESIQAVREIVEKQYWLCKSEGVGVFRKRVQDELDRFESDNFEETQRLVELGKATRWAFEFGGIEIQKENGILDYEEDLIKRYRNEGGPK